MRRLVIAVLAGSTILASACTDPVLEKRVADLEQRVNTLEQQQKARPNKIEAARGAATAATSEQEAAAATLLREANTLVSDMKYDEAKIRLAALAKEYPTTRAARSSRRMADELSVIGQDAGSLDVQKWYQGDTTMDQGKATLVVFWEVWCPHCRREVPALESTYEKYHPEGLNLVAVTKLTKSATDAKVVQFMKENRLTFPIAKETGDLSQRFGVQGIPAAAVIKDGKVVWRGHPARLTDEMLQTWLGTSGEG